jgi:glyoxylase-like metal-dependent hydrolase (beta-lactamase superfamily II)
LARPEIIGLENGAFAENCYVVGDRASGDAVLVDPGEDAALFLRRLAAERYRLTAIWITHAHLDHILGVRAVVAHTPVPIYLHPADRALYDRLPEQAALWFDASSIQAPPPPDHALAHGDTVRVGAFDFEVRHVPGHSPGSVAFVGHGSAIVGDALFAGSIGRTDLPGGDTDTLLASIADRLLTLPDDTIVHPGHGPATTVGRERATNPFLTGALRFG